MHIYIYMTCTIPKKTQTQYVLSQWPILTKNYVLSFTYIDMYIYIIHIICTIEKNLRHGTALRRQTSPQEHVWAQRNGEASSTRWGRDEIPVFTTVA